MGITAKLIAAAGRVAGGTLVASAFQLLFAFLTARILGPQGRGVLVLVATTATYSMLLTSLGVVIPARVMLGGSDAKTVLAQYVGLALLLGAVQLVVTAILVDIILAHSGISLDAPQVITAGIYGSSLLIAYLLTHALFGVGRSGNAVAVQGVGGAAQLIAGLALGLFGVKAVWPFISAPIIGAALQIAVSLTALARAGYPVRPTVSASTWRRLTKTAPAGMGVSFGQAAVLKLDRIFVGVMLSATAVGVYSVAATATDVVMVAPTALSQVLFHRLASKSVDPASARKARVLSMFISAAIAGALFLIAPFAIQRALGDRFMGAVDPLRILLLAALALSSYQLDAYSLSAMGEVGRAAVATVAGLVVVIGADLLLIPSRGIVGAAWASVIAYCVMAAIARAFARRIRPSGPPMDMRQNS